MQGNNSKDDLRKGGEGSKENRQPSPPQSINPETVIPTSDDSVVRTVLVASAVAGRRQLLDVLLMSQGFEVVQREDGQGVLEFLKDNTPDAVIVDIDLPGADGRDICSRIRSIKRLANLAVVLITPSVLELGGPDNLRAIVRTTSADLVLPEPMGDKNIGGRLHNLFLERAQACTEAEGASPEALEREATARSRHSLGMAERAAMTVASLEDEVRVLRAQLKAYRRQQQPREPGNKVNSEQTEGLDPHIAELQERNESLQQDLERQKEASARLEQESDALRSQVGQRDSAIKELERRLQSSLDELEQRNAREVELLGDLVAEREALARRNEEITAQNQQIQALSETLEERSAAVDALQQELKEQSTAKTALQQELESVRAKAEQQAQELGRRKAEDKILREYLQRILQVEQGMPLPDQRVPLISAGSMRG